MDFKHEIGNDCAFNIEKNGEFCAPTEVVDKLKQVIGNYGAGLSKIIIDDKIVLSTLKTKLGCENETCVLKHPDISNIVGADTVNKIIHENFKPIGPRNNTNWFSNNDIDSVLRQVQKKYTDKKFLHIEFQMIDFAKIGTALAKLDWPTKYSEGYRTFGTVFNTDKSTGRGQHWFSIYASVEDSEPYFTLEYFNSSGEDPMDEIVSWMKDVKLQWQPFFVKKIKDMVVTHIVNQEDNHSCGAYSLYYIMSRLSGTPCQYFAHNAIGDENMLEFRKYLFRS